ncbi:MAG TPA: hypothetical protein PKA49_05200 [Tepidiformaceae bacterium]|jgi:hypothetical protein|nr:hypothetical protein [Thermoflexaceae bacterium]HMS58232.1 hypothetical protein [Tepidiformaceae bacterium]
MDSNRPAATPAKTATAIFTDEELWLLQSVIRHEAAQHDQWRVPPADMGLNDQVAESILRCEELGLCEAALILTYEDCLVIDYCVPQSAKAASGVAIGKQVLMKSFRARRAIQGGDLITTEEPASLSGEELQERLRQQRG